MHIKISKENFLKAGVLAEKITGKNLNLPILSSFKITANKGTIKIISTNLDVGFEISSPAKIEKEGEIVISAKLINNTVLNTKDDIIELKEENNNLKLSGKNSLATLKTSNKEEFPILPKFKKESGFKINTNEFLLGLKTCVFAASLSYFKPEIASVYFLLDRDKIIFAATDSFRLIEKSFPNGAEINNTSFLIPLKAVNELIYILEEISKDENQIEVAFNKNEFSVFNNKFNFFSRLTEGVFPDYNQFIPKNFIGEAILDKNEVLSVLKASNVFLSRLNEIILEIYPEKEIIEFKTSNSDLGEYYYNTKIEKRGFEDFKEEKIKLVLNLKYLLDGISKIDASKIIFKLSDDGKPVIIKGEEDNSIIYLVMPMKL